MKRTPIDFLAADGHKWLLGPEGAGLLFVRRDWIDRLRPIGVGSNSVTGSYNEPEPRLRAEARRRPLGGRLLQHVGPARVRQEPGAAPGDRPGGRLRRILDRAEAVRERARAAGWTLAGPDRPEERSGIVVLDREGSDNDAVVRALRSQGVAVSCRRGLLRVSPHLYNGDEDLDRLADGLRGRP